MKVAEAFVALKLRTQGFLSSLRGAEQKTERSANRIGRSFDRMSSRLTASLKSLAASLAGLFAFSAITRGIRSLTEELDLLAKRARTIGISPQTLAGFGFAAGQSTGLSPLQAQVALERFTKRTSEGLAGEGEGARTLKALGLDTTAFAQANPFDRLIQFSDALRNVTDQGQRLAYTQKLLGDEARLLAPLLAMDRAEITALMDEHARLRGNIGLAAVAAERMNDAIDRASQAFRGLTSGSLLFFSEGVVAVSDAFVLLKKGIDDTLASLLRLGGSFGGTLGGVLEGIRRAITYTPPPGFTTNEFGGIERISGAGGGMSAAQIGLNTQLGTFNIASSKVQNTLDRIAKSNELIAAEVKRRAGVLT